MGKNLVAQLRNEGWNDLLLFDVDTPKELLADYAARADLILGPMGIVLCDALMGEITAAMATAVSSSSAYKILIPVNRCNHFIAGCQGGSLSDYIRQVCEEVGRHLAI